MTVEEYKAKLEEYVLGRQKEYYIVFNKFNVDAITSHEFIKRGSHTVHFESSDSIEELEGVITEIKAKVAELKAIEGNRQVSSFYEVVGDYDGGIEEAYMEVVSYSMRPYDTINFEAYNNIIRTELRDVEGCSIYGIVRGSELRFISGAISWEELVDVHRPR